MKAVYLTEPGNLVLRTDEPQPEVVNPDDVIIKTAYCGICPWDVRVYNGKKNVPLPRILGHEATGTVTAVGSAVRDLPVGTPVVADFIRKCGVCSQCRAGRSNTCLQPEFLKGGFEEYVRIPRSNVFPLASAENLKAAALTEPLACVVRGQKMLGPRPGTYEVIVGAGPIGLLHMQTAAAYGARTIVIDLIDSRLEKAAELGADFCINSSREDQRAAVERCTEGHMADAVAVTVASTPVVRNAIDLLAKGGALNIFAGIYPQDELTIDPNIIHYREIRLLGSADSTHADFVDALDLIESGKVKTEELISDLVPLERLDEGFIRVNERGGLKVVASFVEP
jgi:L-iditol 2-dehydrogenase